MGLGGLELLDTEVDLRLLNWQVNVSEIYSEDEKFEITFILFLNMSGQNSSMRKKTEAARL